MKTTLDEIVRQIVKEELAKNPASEYDYTPLQEFMDKTNLKRVQLWRWEKSGKIKFHRIGKKIFVPNSEVRRIFTLRKIEA